MKRTDTAILAGLLALLAAALGAALMTRGWADYRNRLHLGSHRASQPWICDRSKQPSSWRSKP